MSNDKQLSGISLRAVEQKRRLDQALTTKEFAVLAGVSYATAREWLHMLGFPALSGLVFWRDFVLWRCWRTGLEASPSIHSTPSLVPAARPQNGNGKIVRSGHWFKRAPRIPHNPVE